MDGLLPKKKKERASFKEKDFQTMIKHYADKYKGTKYCPFHMGEAKISRGNTVAFSKFKPQQIPSLEEASDKGFYYKMTDASLGKKPSDYFIIDRGMVALMFKADWSQKEAWFLDIEYATKIRKKGFKSIRLTDCQLHGIRIDFNKL